jgi:hypothetical protein
MSIESRLRKIEGSIGAGEPFTEGVHPGDAGLFIQYQFFGVDENDPYPPGRHHETGEEAPEGHQKLAELMGMGAAVMLVFSDHFEGRPEYADDIAQAKESLGLDGTEDEETVMARCRQLGLERGFNKAEMKELDRCMAGTYRRPKQAKGVLK